MNGTLYRLEALRLLRTHTLLLLVLAFTASGAVGPLTAYFMEDLLRLADPEGELAALDLEVPTMTAGDALASHVELVAPLGVLLVVLVAAMALTVDAAPGRSVFYRSRVSGTARLILPRVVLPALAAVLAHLVGALVAWAFTAMFFDGPPLPATMLGALLGGVYMVFVVAVVALASSLVRNALAVVGIAVLVLVVCAGAGSLPFLAEWAPGALLQGMVLPAVGAPLGDLLPAIATTVVLTVGALALALNRSGAREI
ncbi:ABC transporter [Nocardiopsis sp. NPDC055551]|uniref:ABC transporter n=1 Tax=Nocardiopsis sp. NPDC006832 TaxID=3157188 RepID=UPI0033C1C503